MFVLSLKLYQVCMPVPGEMDKPEPTSDSRMVGRRGPGSAPRASACGDKRQSRVSKGQSNTSETRHSHGTGQAPSGHLTCVSLGV